MPFRLLIPALVVVSTMTACSHARYRYAPRGHEAERLGRTQTRFLQAVNADGTAPTDDAGFALDLDARLALLELLQKTAVEHAGENGPSRRLLSVAALLVSGGDMESPFTGEELQRSGWHVLQEAITKRLGLDSIEEALLGAVLGRRMAREVDPVKVREELMRRLDAAQVSGCEVQGPQASYSADLLSHVETPTTDTFRRWRERVQSAHLVSLSCGDSRGLLLLTQDKGEDAPEVAAWQFFTKEQWDAVAPKLEEVWGR